MPTYAYSITHSRPMRARGRHLEAANDALRTELQALADQIAARPSTDTLRLRQSAPVIPRAPLPEGAYRMRTTCSLCGDASDVQVCARCDVGLRELGL